MDMQLGGKSIIIRVGSVEFSAVCTEDNETYYDASDWVNFNVQEDQINTLLEGVTIGNISNLNWLLTDHLEISQDEDDGGLSGRTMVGYIKEVINF